MKKIRLLLPTMCSFILFSASCVQQQTINKPDKQENEPGKQEKEPGKTLNDGDQNGKNGKGNKKNDPQPPTNIKKIVPPNSDVLNDLDSIEKDVTIYIPLYKNRDANSSWAILKNDINDLITLLSLKQNIKSKYTIEYSQNNMPKIDNNSGIITNIGVKFSHMNQSKVLHFNLRGFATFNNNLPKNNKNEYLVPLSTLPESVKGLYPSLIAHMLLHAEDRDKYNQKQEASNNKYIINFDQLENKNNDLFYQQVAPLNISLKEAFFEYNENFKEKYLTKVVAAKFNDVEGTLGIKIQISNTENGPRDEAELTKEYEFSGLRKIDLNNSNQNVIDFYVLPTDLVEIINKYTQIKKVVLDNQNNINQSIDLSSKLSEFSYKTLITALNKIVNVSIVDNQLNAYNFRKGSDKISSFAGLKQKFGLYPFYTRFHDNIKNVRLEITNNTDTKTGNIYFDVELPIFMQSSFTDLSDNLATSKPITINVKSEFNLDKIKSSK